MIDARSGLQAGLFSTQALLLLSHFVVESGLALSWGNKQDLP